MSVCVYSGVLTLCAYLALFKDCRNEMQYFETVYVLFSYRFAIFRSVCDYISDFYFCFAFTARLHMRFHK